MKTVATTFFGPRDFVMPWRIEQLAILRLFLLNVHVFSRMHECHDVGQAHEICKQINKQSFQFHRVKSASNFEWGGAEQILQPLLFEVVALSFGETFVHCIT